MMNLDFVECAGLCSTFESHFRKTGQTCRTLQVIAEQLARLGVEGKESVLPIMPAVICKDAFLKVVHKSHNWGFYELRKEIESGKWDNQHCFHFPVVRLFLIDEKDVVVTSNPQRDLRHAWDNQLNIKKLAEAKYLNNEYGCRSYGDLHFWMVQDCSDKARNAIVVENPIK